MCEARVEFRTFFLENRRWLVRQAYALCRDSYEAEDLAQSAFVKVYQRWCSFERHSELRGYLKSVLHSVFIDSRRRAAARRELLGDAIPEELAGTPVEPDPVGAHGPVLQSLGRLPRRQRQVIFLRFWLDLDTVETSRVLGCTPGSVTSQTSRGLARLRAVLTGDPALVI
ncbi:SigE family RNA polymerase sigma factor [Saccharothrix sp. BKS2]|uniref:SigE family RNA polymerase sigma factor n=1 Tax=Saccharothrix sp. BKS2 TaxID=3064400 RepID=UPI0039E7D860